MISFTINFNFFMLTFFLITIFFYDNISFYVDKSLDRAISSIEILSVSRKFLKQFKNNFYSKTYQTLDQIKGSIEGLSNLLLNSKAQSRVI